MNDAQDLNPLNTPKFIRERESWYKAGADTMAMHVGLGVLIVGLIVGIASWFVPIDPYQAATAVVIGTWVFIAAAGFYAEVSARSKAAQGGVEIDRF